MRRTITQLHRIFLAGLLAIALILSCGAPLVARAEETAEKDDGTQGITTAATTDYSSTGTISLDFLQKWSVNGNASTSVRYVLEPVAELTDEPYTYHTSSDVESGYVRYAFGSTTEGGNVGETTLRGDNATGRITFSWTKAGVYVFNLHATSSGGSNYTYDRTIYRIRLYVRDTTQSVFITVQDLSQVSETETGKADAGKVSSITFRHRYSEPPAPTPGGDDDGGSDSRTIPSTPRRANEITEDGTTGSTIGEISESGNNQNGDQIGNLTEYGGNENHGNAYTGDDSLMNWYLIIMLAAGASLAACAVYRNRTHQHEQ